MKKESNYSLNSDEIKSLLKEIGDDFAARSEWAEIAVYGGAALLLHFDDRPSTKDIDYIGLSGAEKVVEVANQVGEKHGLSDGWFNDAVVMNLDEKREDQLFGVFPQNAVNGGLRVMVGSPRYILAMKVVSMRSSFESNDVLDVWNLLDHCEMFEADEIVSMAEEFFPNFQIDVRNKAILKDIIEAKKDGKSFDPMLGW